MFDERVDLWLGVFFLFLVGLGLVVIPPLPGFWGLILSIVLFFQILFGSLWILCGVVVAWAVSEDDRLARFDFDEKAMLVIAGPLTLALLASWGIPEWLSRMWLPLELKVPETKQNQGTLAVSEFERVIDQISDYYLRKVEDLLRR